MKSRALSHAVQTEGEIQLLKGLLYGKKVPLETVIAFRVHEVYACICVRTSHSNLKNRYSYIFSGASHDFNLDLSRVFNLRHQSQRDLKTVGSEQCDCSPSEQALLTDR